MIKHSLLENESRYVVHHNQALPKFCSHERSWRRGHGGKIYAHGDCFYFFFFFFFFFFLYFCDLIPLFSSFLSLFPSILFYLFLRISYAGPFGPHLIGVDGAALRRYNDKPNIFGPKI